MIFLLLPPSFSQGGNGGYEPVVPTYEIKGSSMKGYEKSDCENETWTYEVSPCCVAVEFCHPDHDVVYTTWNFGDGTIISSTDRVVHCYCNYGTYTVTGINNIGSNYYSWEITSICFNPEFTYNFEYFSGCPAPWECNVGEDPLTEDAECNEVVLLFSDETESWNGEEILNVKWQIDVYNGGVLQDQLVEWGEEVLFTFNEWHGGIRLVLHQTAYSCLGSRTGTTLLKVDCFSDGGGSEDALATNISSESLCTEEAMDLKEIQKVHIVKSGIPIYYQIYSILGNRVEEGRLQTASFQIDDFTLSSGVYYIQLFDKKKQLIATEKRFKR